MMRLVPENNPLEPLLVGQVVACERRGGCIVLVFDCDGTFDLSGPPSYLTRQSRRPVTTQHRGRFVLELPMLDPQGGIGATSLMEALIDTVPGGRELYPERP